MLQQNSASYAAWGDAPKIKDKQLKHLKYLALSDSTTLTTIHAPSGGTERLNQCEH